MEVRIGVKGAPRELTLECPDSAETVQKAVDKALKDGAPTLTLTDDRGRKVMVATALLAYVEIASEADARRVGFGTL